MNTTPPEAPPPPHDTSGEAPYSTGPRVGRDQVRDLGRLRRSIADRKVAGVAGGLGRHLDVDPLVLRIAFVVLVFFGGAGLILYAACWLLVPEENSGKAALNLDDRSRSFALVIAGAIAALALIGDSLGTFWFPWPLAIIALVALWLLTRNGSSSTPPASPAYGPAPAPPGYGAPAAGPAYPAPTSTAPAYAAPAAPAPEATAYAGPPAYVPPPTYVPPPRYVAPPRPENPRKRGPILFWFTLALIALAEGLLGIADLAGANVAGPAYPALAVGISGLMLLVGAFYGRAGGIILIGLLSTIGLVGATAAQEIDTESTDVAPVSAADVGSRYFLAVGEQRIDLSGVTDLDELDGRTIEVEGNVGSIDITLPHGVRATVDANIDGPGEIKLFGGDQSDWGVDDRLTVGDPGDPRIFLNLNLHVGTIEVTH